MLTFFLMGICFLAICLFCIFLIRRLSVPSGLAPLAVTCTTMLFFTLAGCLGILTISVWIYFALAALCGVLAFVLKPKNDNKLLSPAFLLFVLCSVGLLCLLAIRQPLLNEWDDFSLWATAVKMTAETNVLYPDVTSGFPWEVTQSPGFIIMAYFFNFFGDFAPWRMFFAYDIVMLSAFAAICSCVPFKKWQVAVPLYLVCAIVPFIGVHARMIYFTTPYMTGYVDIPMGILMGGAFAFYFCASECKNKSVILWVCAIIGGVTLSKATGMPLGMLCAAVITMDIIINHKNDEFVLNKFIKGIWAKVFTCVALFASVAVCYIGFSKYLGTSENLGGESNMTAFALIINGLLLLFGLTPLQAGIPFTDKFALVFNNMVDTFLSSDVTILGTGLSVFGFIISILLIAYFICGDKLYRRRIALFGTVGLLSFIPYYIFIGFTYVFIFKGNQGVELVDYNRYVGSYYAALILGSLALLCISAVKEQRRITIKQGIIMLCGGIALPVISMILSTAALGRRMPAFNDLKLPLGLFCLLLFVALYGHFKNVAAFACLFLSIEAIMLFNYVMPKHLCIINYPDVVYDEIAILQKNADRMNQIMGKPSNVFFISSTDDGLNWFKYHYALFPSILDYSYGSGELADGEAISSSAPFQRDVSIGQLAAYLYQSNNEYLYVNSTDYYFRKSYESLFEGEIVDGFYKIEKKPGARIYDKKPTSTQLGYLPNRLSKTEFVYFMDNPADYLCFVLLEEEARLK